ncbi:MAG: DNA/RNA nuclease SfsA, partial [Anaerovoracaceae bacterium]
EDKEAFVIFVLQMKGMKLFRPNDEKHKAFGDALRHAAANGVRVMAFECDVSKDQIKLSGQVETEL